MINTREITSEYRLSHWAGVIQERNTSGLSVKAYCESIGIHTNVYFYWQRKIRETACRELLPATVDGEEKAVLPVMKQNGAATTELKGVPGGWAVCDVKKPLTTPSEASVMIEIGKSRVAAPAGVDIELLSNVCRMLMSIC